MKLVTKKNQYPALAKAEEKLRELFSGINFHASHREAREVLAELGRDHGVLVHLVRSSILSESFRNAPRINPVLAIPMLENDRYTLVANIWIPRPDGRTDISHQSIHHHGNLLLTSLSAYGPGYESILFKKLEPKSRTLELQAEQVYVNEAGKIEFVDVNTPHIVFYPQSLSVTYALWSKDRPYASSKLRRVPESWKKIARKVLGILPLGKNLGVNQATGFDFTVKGGKIVPLNARAKYSPGSKGTNLAALAFVAAELGINDAAVCSALGLQSLQGAKNEFEPEHIFLADANLERAEVFACLS